MILLFHPNNFWFKSIIFTIGFFFILILFFQIVLISLFPAEKIQYGLKQYFEEQGQEITFDDTIGRSWFPSPNINLYHLKITDKKNHHNQTTIDKVNIRLSFLSLFGNKNIQKLTFDQGHFSFAHHKNDILDMINNLSATKTIQVKRICFRDSSLTIKDPTSKQGYHLESLNGDWFDLHSKNTSLLASGILNIKNKEFIFDMSGQISQDQQQISFNNTKLSIKTALKTIGEINLTANGHFFWNKKTHQFSADSTQINGYLQDKQTNFTIQLYKWLLDKSLISIQKIQSNLNYQHNEDNILNIDWQSQNLKLTPHILNLNNLIADIRYQNNRNISIINYQGDYEYSFTTKKYALNNVSILGRQTNTKGASTNLSTELSGSIQSQNAQLSNIYLSGLFNNAPLLFKGKLAHDTKMFSGELNLERFNLTHSNFDDESLLPQKMVTLLNQFLPYLNYLHDYRVNSKIHIKHFNTPAMRMSSLSTKLEANRHKIIFNQITSKMYNGLIKGVFTAFNKVIPEYEIQQEMNNIDVHEWFQDWMGISYLSGVAKSTFNIKTSGQNLQQLQENLNGNTNIIINNGSINGIDIIKLLYQNKNLSLLSQNELSSNFETSKQTKFDAFHIQNTWHNGVGSTIFTSSSRQNFAVQGGGSINLNDNTLNYALLIKGQINLLGRITPINFPLKVTGTLIEPIYSLDLIKLTPSSKE